LMAETIGGSCWLKVHQSADPYAPTRQQDAPAAAAPVRVAHCRMPSHCLAPRAPPPLAPRTCPHRM
jgi:hypothetical protein